MFLEECKYGAKKKKIPKYITDDIEISSDSDREHSDEENFDEENPDEENSDEKNSGEENFDEGNLKNTRTVKLFLKHIKKYFFNFFSIYKNDN